MLGGGVGGATVSHLGIFGTFFGDMVCKSPRLELDKTDLVVYPSILAETMGKLLHLSKPQFSHL